MWWPLATCRYLFVSYERKALLCLGTVFVSASWQKMSFQPNSAGHGLIYSERPAVPESISTTNTKAKDTFEKKFQS